MEFATDKVTEGIGQLRRLYMFMASRCYVASRQELLGAGFTRDRIAGWIRNGRLIKLLRGVYSYGRDVETRAAVWRAGLVAAGRGSALTGRSACEVWGFVEARHRLPRVVVVAVGRGETRTLRGQSPSLRQTTFKFVRRQFGPGDIRVRNGLTLVSPVIALMDFAADASEGAVRFAFLEACRLGLFRRRDVDDCFRRIAGRPGAAKLRPLLALWVPELARIRSVFEGTFLVAWIEGGYPMPKVNERVFGYEVDLYWPEHGAVLELDGGTYHSDPAQRAIDAAKQKALEERGLTVLRITYSEFEANPVAAMKRVLQHLESK